MKSEIKLDSRYGEVNKLVRVGNENSLRYKLDTEFNVRVGVIKDNPSQYSFIDPSGGPFIEVGSKIEGHTVKAIYDDLTIEFES